MDYTPKSEDYGDSGHVSSSFDASSRVFESTPKTETDSTPHLFANNPKKRKAQHCDIPSRKLNDLLNSCPSTPQASSTLNESLTREFENFKLDPHFYNIAGFDEPAPKFLKSNGCEKIVTPPSTPEAHMKTFNCTPKKSSSFQKCSSACSMPSPLKEQHDILYPKLKPLDPLRKPLTPQKFKEKLKIGQNSTPYKRHLFISRDNRLFSRILSNDVVMGKIFGYLSNGDLFRVSMVSKSLMDALYRNTKANQRYQTFKDSHKKNKENYKITPPSSPESQNLFREGSVSPNSRNFVEFLEIGSSLNQNQSLTKCPKCEKPSVVDSSIAQCQEVNSCGYIFCQKCDSFSYVPEEFVDKCRGLTLGREKKRRELGDLSNCSPDFNVSSILSSTAENYHSSGYFSGYDTSHTPVSVKRNLSRSFSANENMSKPQKVLFDSNRSLRNLQMVKTQKRDDKRKSISNAVPLCENVRKTIEVIEPPSPPKVKTYSACSKQSKRNLKRLTR